MKSLAEIKSTLSEKKDSLYERYRIKSLAVFGSYARNEQGDDSDLDLLVEFNGKIGGKFIDLADELEEILHLKVDLVSRKGVKERYLQSIESDLIHV
ncbi:MAG: nucleotidyltransferase family protein [Cyclobacteriaceae bacterium]